MQITAELDSQHLEKLHTLEKILKKSTSELIAFAIDDMFIKNASKTEGHSAYLLMQQSGFIGCVESEENLSENYKDSLDWNHKI
jgi:hypothetical protein